MSLVTLPKEMYAEIARFLGSDFPGQGFRRAVGVVQIKDIINDQTYSNGALHSFDDQPARINTEGSQFWYLRGELHRDNGPAIIRADGSRYWYQHGKIHHDNDQPAIVFANGNKY